MQHKKFSYYTEGISRTISIKTCFWEIKFYKHKTDYKINLLWQIMVVLRKRKLLAANTFRMYILKLHKRSYPNRNHYKL